MILVDTALKRLEDEGRPIRVGIVGAGYMGRGLALQIIGSMKGMRLVGISNRTLSEAKRAFEQAGIDDPVMVDNRQALEDAVARGRPAVMDDPEPLCTADNVDVVVEATGEVEFGARVALQAIGHRKHIVLMNAELDAVVGPILKVYADRQGVVITNIDGDQPGVVMNLFRFVDTIGYQPVLAGNIKGLQDHYRNPDTQRAFAERNRQKPKMITSFADGTKIAMEMAVVANATGFRVGTRGMYGPRCGHVKEAVDLFPYDQLMNGGLVDYVLGAEPGPGVFVLGYNENPIKRQYMEYLKMGEGPLYVFYTPYHLPHLETPITVARAAIFGDAATVPLGGPVVDVITAAKRDLKAGETLDGIGGFTCYGLTENADQVTRKGFLPMSLSEGCRLKHDIPRDGIVGYDDIELPSGRIVDRLRVEQDARFSNRRRPARPWYRDTLRGRHPPASP